MSENKVKSALSLKRLFFDRIEFHRQGIKNDNEIKFQMQVGIKQRKAEEVYCVSLVLEGEKEKEYYLVIGLEVYFAFDNADDLTEEQKESIIKKNTVAIMMPYMRSQLSLLTAQPEVECVVLPPFNIVKMMEN